MVDPAQETDGTVEGFGGRVTVQRRAPAAVQLVSNAAVYIIRLASSFTSGATQILAELNAHLDVLRSNPSATLILAMPLLPEPKAVSTDIEAKARLQDLCRLQLTNQPEMGLDELLDMVNWVGDSNGRLVIASRLCCPQKATVALGVKYQAFTGRTHIAEQVVV